jgi:hypothetical protein
MLLASEVTIGSGQLAAASERKRREGRIGHQWGPLPASRSIGAIGGALVIPSLNRTIADGPAR